MTTPDMVERFRKAYENAIPADSFALAVAFATGPPEDLDVSQILFRPARPGTLTSRLPICPI
jgi:hypothetical protein